MNRIKFLSKITYTAGILLAMALTLSCSSDDKDNKDSSSVIFACNDAYTGFCMEYTKFKNETVKKRTEDECKEENASIVSKCSRDGVQLECPFDEDPDYNGKGFVYNGLFWQEMGGNLKCSDLYRLIDDED